VDLAGRVLETHSEEAAIWSVYANALQRLGSVDEAIQALDRVRSIDAEYPNVTARQGSWLLEEGRLDDAIPVFQEAIGRGEQSADAVANIIFANGYREGVDNRDWNYAVRVIGQAGEFDVSPEMRQQLDFWLAYSIYQRAQAQQEPQTLETAQATLPQFQRALRLLNGCADYTQRNNLENNRQQLISATNTYIEIQEAIIRRGR
jgi:tetratricopeptide (TPR) repeat protein